MRDINKEFGMIKAGYVKPKSKSPPKNVNLIYHNTVIATNIPIGLARWKKKEMIRVNQCQANLFKEEYV